ncbi:hypothetical protein PMAYCL1PPCAC_19505 [Pristionchus mayeri]|uniref:F-box domain-containing protein n=1 Tax=Pristionchus mayeri TaxID=1317129 RepID=A0AAN5CRM5_9BILA|nr:hypothetical protein PMAYCL1PPCAC_19505 [Pristionchus mayeri]
MSTTLLDSSTFPSLKTLDSSLTRVNIVEKLSQLEQLPRELLRSIIGFARENVFALRLTSSFLRSLVDDYVSSPKCILVDDLVFTNIAENSDESPEIAAHVSKSKSALFELRMMMQLRTHSFDFNIRIKRGFASLSDHPNIYKMNFGPSIKDEHQTMLDCVGKRVARVTLNNYNNGRFSIDTKKLEDLEFKQLDVALDVLCSLGSNYLMNTIKAHKIDHLSLSTREIRIFDQESFLLELSSLVRSLSLGKRPDSKENDNSFDIPARVILEMFSKKMDTLCLYNRRNNGDYFPPQTAETLREKLPLLGKHIWFQVTVRKFPEVFSKTVNDHIVRGTNAKVGGTLSVKHTSRLGESYSKYE